MSGLYKYNNGDHTNCCVCSKSVQGITICSDCNHLIINFDDLRNHINNLEVIDWNAYRLLSLAFNNRLSLLINRINISNVSDFNIESINISSYNSYFRRCVAELKELRHSVDVVKSMLNGD